MTDTLDPALEALVKPLTWYEYPNVKHDYGQGVWEAYSANKTYTILDVGADGKNGNRYYFRGYSQSETLEQAKAAAQVDHNARIVACLSASPQAEIDRLREDAERWRALMSSERLHFMGCSGFNIEGPHSVEDEGAPLATAHATPKPGAQLHFGMEFWSEFKWRSSEEAERYTDRFERDFMVVYVDEMRRRALHPQTPNGGQRD